jgi:hypothetical protein
VTLAVTSLGQQGSGAPVLEQALARQPGVRYAYVCAATEMAYVVCDASQFCPAQLVAAVAGAGFCAEPPESR